MWEEGESEMLYFMGMEFYCGWKVLDIDNSDDYTKLCNAFNFTKLYTYK